MSETRDWVALGAALKSARDARRPRLTQVAAADALGVSRGAIQDIDSGNKGRGFQKVTQTIRAYAQLVGWTPDSPDRVLAGGIPVLAEAQAPARPQAQSESASLATLPLRIARALASEGALLDTKIVPLPGGGEAVIVVKGKSQATPEQIGIALTEWERKRALLDEEPAEDPPIANEA